MKHVSMRVPWRDRPWDGHVCDHPLDNSSCLLLANIGAKRDDEYETENAGKEFHGLDTLRLPCLSERGSFMSAVGYSVTKTHPYNMNKALKGHLSPTNVDLPGFAFEAVPFRWLNRETFFEEVSVEANVDADFDAEERINDLIGFKPSWLMDGNNQKASIKGFFDQLEVGSSLVFIYMKDSPLQESATGRLLVGAAIVEDIRLPGMWDQDGGQPFDSSMWETTLIHSLRPGQKDGVLLPYQELARLMDDGVDVSSALAWAPEGSVLEFSYVTEHVSDDTAIEALRNLRAAGLGMRGLGIEMPERAFSWIDDQIERAWQARGPVPGLGAVLRHWGVKDAHRIARTAHEWIDLVPEDISPLDALLTRHEAVPVQVVESIAKSVVGEWAHTDEQERRAYSLICTFDVTTDQVDGLADHGTEGDLSLEELVDDPYYASICTYGSLEAVGFGTVDRAMYPAPHVTWQSRVPAVCRMEEDRDARRVQALIVDLLHEAASEGHTILAQSEIIDRAGLRELEPPCKLSDGLLATHVLDAASLAGIDDGWSPLSGASLANGDPALKLLGYANAKETISSDLHARRQWSRHTVAFDPRAEIDEILKDYPSDVTGEDAARAEKAAGLAELYASRLSVLIGSAGTGKTTLLSALVNRPDIRAKGVLLLAPTGKARVQLQQKVGAVGVEGKTLASWLTRLDRYDGQTGRYLTDETGPRVDAGLVVIDEASMLTEEMLAATLSALGQVDRLILVGDVRQLPPIGAGRPFVDIVNLLMPMSIPIDKPRVGAGYVELTVTRRQDGELRDDLALASWFGSDPAGSVDDGVWHRLRSGSEDGTLCYLNWSGSNLLTTLKSVLLSELNLRDDVAEDLAFKISYGGEMTPDLKYLNWPDGASKRSEEWQIMSPVRSRLFGTTEINRYIKKTWRRTDLELAQKGWGWRNPKPFGPEQIVRGDKVMQNKNEKRNGWPKEVELDYVANGEIGVVVGRWGNKPGRLSAEVEFSSQPKARYQYNPSAAEDPPLELAWAVTVHKSQGSEFATTFVVLPAKTRVSRELLYTAFTRQTKRLVILHEGTVDDLVHLARPWNSETARRMTDLFEAPDPKPLTIDNETHYLDANLVHIAAGGVAVRSKNEVIVAGILEELVPGRWTYEAKCTGSDGTPVLPDFTIRLNSGETVFWEHLGMMNDPKYAKRWAEKKRWYVENGINPVMDGQARLLDVAQRNAGPNGMLVWTDDHNGVDHPAWRAMANELFGAKPQKAAKKVAKRTAGRQL